jgi:aldose 1-epimerase
MKEEQAMPFQVRTETYPALDRDGTVIVLEETGGAARAEVWPACGFNGYRWRVRHGEQLLDLLYADPTLFRGGRPTASGTPILFPFPNRIRDGRFSWDGRDYQLPRNDHEHVNAIHGFVFERPWRVLDRGADADSAWVTGEFRGSADAPDLAAHWPADFTIRVTYRLTARRLTIRAEVINPDSRPLPFGLGYHPYFRVPLVPNSGAADCTVQAHAREMWELQQFLPTGRRRPVEGALDLTAPRPFEGLQLDDVYTGIESEPAADGLRELGVLRQPSYRVGLRVLAAPAFRELVLYTPRHRQAVCLEPYTCPTNAVNLQQQGIETGWRVLSPGETWAADVAFEVAAG